MKETSEMALKNAYTKIAELEQKIREQKRMIEKMNYINDQMLSSLLHANEELRAYQEMSKVPKYKPFE